MTAISSTNTTRFDTPHPPTLRAGAVYAVAGGNHVTILIDAADTGGVFDLIEVLAQSGGGPPPHRHAFAEWFSVLEGELHFFAPQNGGLQPLGLVKAGGTYAIPPWTPHTTENAADAAARFLVAGQPGVMSRYFAQAGVAVPDELAPPATHRRDRWPSPSWQPLRHRVHRRVPRTRARERGGNVRRWHQPRRLEEPGHTANNRRCS